MTPLPKDSELKPADPSHMGGEVTHGDGSARAAKNVVGPYLAPAVSLSLLAGGIAIRYAEAQFFTSYVELACFGAAYFLVSWRVLRSAVARSAGGNIFNESTLMGVATLGAFAIGRYPEAVAVMIVLTIGGSIQEGTIARAQKLALGDMATSKDTFVSMPLAVMPNAGERRNRTQQFISMFAIVFTPIVVLLAQFVVVVPALFEEDFVLSDWVYRALVFLVISGPGALVVSIPLAYLGGISAASQQGITATALADVGIPLGRLGTDTRTEAAGMVTQTEVSPEVTTARRISAATHRVVWQNISLVILVKAVVLGLAAWGVATMWEAVLADLGVALLAIMNAVRIQRMDFSSARAAL